MMGDPVWEQDERLDPTDPAKREWGSDVDPFDDDTPLVCGIEAGEVCEACD